MRRLFTSILIILCITATYAQTNAHITVTGATGQSPDAFLNNNFAGEGVTLHDCTFNRSAAPITSPTVGTFSNTNPTFPFSSGILLTTGNISLAASANNNTGATASAIEYSANPKDNDLQGIATAPLNANFFLEFSFYNTNRNDFSLAEFNYIFASEEYPEYVCDVFNDVFAFWLYEADHNNSCFTHPHPWNIAFVPGEPNTSVAINNVHEETDEPDCPPRRNYYRNNNDGQAVQYDGYTVLRALPLNNDKTTDRGLTASATLCSCREYKMRISIANVGDNSLDSGVFLEQGSFSLPKSLTVTDSISPSEMDHSISPDVIDTVVQNCSTADIQMHYGEPIENQMTVVLFSDGGSANQNDFNVLRLRDNGDVDTLRNGDSFLFLEGDTLLNLRLEVSESAQFAMNEAKTVQLVLKSILCPQFRYLDGRQPEERAQYDTLNYVILGNKRFTLTSDTTSYCDRCDSVVLKIKGGTEPLYYSWTPANLLNTPHARKSSCNITSDTVFKIVVNDRWHCLVDSCYHTVNVTTTPELQGHYHVTPNIICVPDTVHFISTATPATTHRWIITSNTYNTKDTLWVRDTNYLFTRPGKYSINYKAYEDTACAAEVTLVNYINAGLKPTASFYFNPTEAEVGDTIYFTNESTGLDVHYNWSFGDGSNSTEENPIHIYYSENSDNYNVILTVSDDAGCQDMYTLSVPVVDNHVLYVPNSFTPNKDGLNDVFLPVVACVDPKRYYLVVYDRNGSIVFATNNTEMGWDGTINGKECPSGVYTYFISYYRYNNLKQELLKTGKINLIR